MSKVLFTTDDLDRLEKAIEAINHEIASLSKRIEMLKHDRRTPERKLEALKILLDGELPALVTIDEGAARVSDQKVDQVENAARTPEEHGGERLPSWPKELVRIVRSFDRAVTYDDIRTEVRKGPLAGKFAESDKGFYHAIARLSDRGHIVKHKGWVFSPDLYKKFKIDLDLGVVNDLLEASSWRASPMGEAIIEFVNQHPKGVKSGDIVSHLKRDSRFRETLEKNATGAYNVISRLVKRGQLEKKGRVVYPPNEQEPPEGGSHPVTGEADPSPNERQSSFDIGGTPPQR